VLRGGRLVLRGGWANRKSIQDNKIKKRRMT
jgi:hypothetical protein